VDVGRWFDGSSDTQSMLSVVIIHLKSLIFTDLASWTISFQNSIDCSRTLVTLTVPWNNPKSRSPFHRIAIFDLCLEENR
jgi:hypothetical protein